MTIYRRYPWWLPIGIPLPGPMLRELVDTSLPGIDLSGLTVKGVDMRRCELASADLKGVYFQQVDASEANFARCFLFLSRIQTSVLHSSSFFGARLENTRLAQSDLQGCDFSLARIFGVEFSGCNLANSSFVGSRLNSAKGRVAFHQCNLRGATFADSTFACVRFSSCDLREADFSRVTFPVRRLASPEMFVDSIMDKDTILPPGF